MTPAELLDLHVPGGEVTEEGLRANVSVGVRYLTSWLAGAGAAAIDNLMEDVGHGGDLTFASLAVGAGGNLQPRPRA